MKKVTENKVLNSCFFAKGDGWKDKEGSGKGGK